MTVSTEVNRVESPGNGSATTFSFSPMLITEASDLVVTLVDEDDIETTLSEGTGGSAYAINVTTYPGTGSITYPENEVTPIPSGSRLVFTRSIPQTQETDLENQGGYYADTQEATFDRIVLQIQDLQEQLDRAVKVSVGSDVVPDDLVDALADSVAAASASEDAAAASATAAASSASAAATSATAAATSATASAASATAAAASAADAAATLNSVLPVRRNAMVNGSLLVWPTDTTFTSVAGYTAEQVYSDTGKVTRITGVTTPYRMRHIRTGLGNQTLTDYFVTDSNDGVRFRSKKVTISFICKLSQSDLLSGGTLNVAILAGNGSNQAPTAVSVFETKTITPTTSDVRYSVTSTSAMASDVTQVGWKISGTTAVGGLIVDGNYFELEAIQIEASDVATDFEHLPAAMIYDECAYLFERKSYAGSADDLVSVGFASSTTSMLGALTYKPKRRIPTITSSNADTFLALTGSGSGQTGTVVAFNEISDTTARIQLTVASGLTSGQGGQIYRDNTDTTYIDISARL